MTEIASCAPRHLGAGSRPAALEGPGGGAGRGVCQPAADPRRARGKRLLRQRGELLERPNAHLYETGRMRRVHLRGHPNILKRLLVQVCGVNLGLLMRHLTGVGTPRSLQGRASALVEALIGLLSGCWGRVRRVWAPERHDRPDSVVGWSGDTPIRTRDSRLTISPFCHGLLDKVWKI